uniref:Apelin n=1 Tax=Gopherus agassizii TaxID=38772 RepID=A0A452GLA3_9SAUR
RNCRLFLPPLSSRQSALHGDNKPHPAPDGRDLEKGNIRNLVHPKGVRNGAGHRQNGWRKSRRPRPRLSHKGPMPF